MSSRRQLLFSIISLVSIFLLFACFDIDTFVQNKLYVFSEKRWILSPRSNEIIHFMLYDGMKILLISFEFLLLSILLIFRNKTWCKSRSSGLLIVFLSLLLVPASVSAIKTLTNVACPKALVLYGGTIPYVPIFKSFNNDQSPTKFQKCFPAAHASGGFALLSLIFIAKTRRRRIQAAIFALSVGWTMGGYKMLIGHHFLSHTLVSMVFAWFVINVIALAVNHRNQRD